MGGCYGLDVICPQKGHMLETWCLMWWCQEVMKHLKGGAKREIIRHLEVPSLGGINAGLLGKVCS